MGDIKCILLFPFQDDRNFEIYTVEIEAEGKLSSEGHKEGTEEFITVFEGELTIEINDCQYKLNSGMQFALRRIDHIRIIILEER